MSSLAIPVAAARRFMRRAQLLDQPAPDLVTALAHLGYVQIDPINVCGRMHDLILRNRVRGYAEGDLLAHLHAAERPGFEQYLPRPGFLAAFPVEAWPFLWPHIIRRRRHRKLTSRQERLAQRILAEIASRGPLTSDDIEHEGRSIGDWGSPGRVVKHVLESLFLQGRVLITNRRNFRRVYDLPERVLPAAVVRAPAKTADETARWAALLRLRQRRLSTLKRGEPALVADLVQSVRIAGLRTAPLYVLKPDLALLESCMAGQTDDAASPPLLLAPLDPLIYDRRLTSSLWDFDYTWEVYTPPAKRMRGYYALPVLAGTEIVGHVDPKADRAAGRLRMVSRSVRRGNRVAPAVGELARWLGLK